MDLVEDDDVDMLRTTSVVITTTWAPGRIDASPVSNPTCSAPWMPMRSANFWFESALIGVV